MSPHLAIEICGFDHELTTGFNGNRDNMWVCHFDDCRSFPSLDHINLSNTFKITPPEAVVECSQDPFILGAEGTGV